MIILEVTFDTTALGREEYDRIASHGTVLNVLGLLNVQWEAVRDNTPGTLTCVIACDALRPGLQECLLMPPVIEYQISEY